MCIPGDHGAASVSSIHGFYYRNPVLLAIHSTTSRTLSFYHTTDHTPDLVLARAFSVLGYPIYQSPPSLSIDVRKPRLSYASIVLFLCLWRITCVGATGKNLSVSPDVPRTPAGILHSNVSLTQYSSDDMPHNSDAFWTADAARTSSLGTENQTRKHRRKAEANDAGEIPEQKFFTPELTEFICYRLPDACARAAYLRQHVRHTLCPELSLLYFLPYVTHLVNHSISPTISRHSNCVGGLRNLVYAESDSAFEPWLTPSITCERSLSVLNLLLLERLHNEITNLEGILERSFCKTNSCLDSNVEGEFCCDKCSTAYRNWYCAVEFPLFIPMEGFHSEPTTTPFFPPESCYSSVLEQTRLSYEQFPSESSSSLSSPTPRYSYVSPTLGTTRSSYRLVAVCAHDYWCTQVETFCPYLNPDNGTSNGGEPGFLCHESHYHHSSLYQYQGINQCPTNCRYTQADLRTLSIPQFNGSGAIDPYAMSAFNSKPCESLQDRCLHTHDFLPVSGVWDDLSHPPGKDVPTDSNTSVPTGSASDTRHIRMRNSVYCWCLVPVLLYILYPYLVRIQLMGIVSEHYRLEPAALSIRTSVGRTPCKRSTHPVSDITYSTSVR